MYEYEIYINIFTTKQSSRACFCMIISNCVIRKQYCLSSCTHTSFNLQIVQTQFKPILKYFGGTAYALTQIHTYLIHLIHTYLIQNGSSSVCAI